MTSNIRSFLIYTIISILYFSQLSLKGHLLLPGDSWNYFYPLKLYYSKLSLYHSFHIWLPYEFLGLPFLGTLQTGILYPLNFLYFFLPLPYVFGFNIIIHYALAAFFTFLYARLLGMKVFPAFVAGLVFAFSGFLMAHKAHISLLNAAVWLPLLLYLYERIRRELRFMYAALASLVVAIQVFAGQYQICVYTYMTLGLFSFWYLHGIAKGKKVRFTLLTIGPILLGSIIALPQILATKELANISWRAGQGYSYFTKYSFPPFMLPQLFFPFFFGGGYGGPYWGDWNLTEMAGFIGTLPLIMGSWAAIKFWTRNVHVKFLSLLALLAFLLLMGEHNPVYRLMYYVPVYKLFRVPARHWLEFDLAISLLFGFGLHALYNERDNEHINREVIAVVGFTTLAIFALIYFGTILVRKEFFLRLISQEVGHMVVNSIRLGNPALFVPFIFMTFYFLWTCLFFRFGFRRNRAFFAINSLVHHPCCSGWQKGFSTILVLVVLAEGFSFGGFHDAHYVKVAELQKEINNPLMLFLKKKARYERVVFLNRETLPLYNVNAKICTLNGYDPLIPYAVHEMVDMEPWGVSINWAELLRNNLILSTLNVRFIAIAREDVPIYKPSEIIGGGKGPVYRQVPFTTWELCNSQIRSKEECSLKSPDGLAMSVIHQYLSLKSNTYYLLTLTARAPDRAPTSMLSFDFYGLDYDFPQQQLDIMPEQIGGSWCTFYKVINTDANIPSQIQLRVFTFSKQRIELRHIEVKELQNYTPPFIVKAKLLSCKEKRLYQEVFRTKRWVIYENCNCLPRVFAVEKLEPIRSIQEAKNWFDLLKFNPAETGLVNYDDLSKIGLAAFSKGKVRITSYSPDRICIEAIFKDGPGFLVLSDQYFPGWNAYVDGKEVCIYCVDGLLRGVVVPEGNHMIEFRYRASRVSVAGIAGLMALALALIGVFCDFRPKADKKRSLHQ